MGPDAPRVVTTYVAIVPTDTVKYELDQKTGILRLDRVQQYSNVCPSLYGFILAHLAELGRAPGK